MSNPYPQSYLGQAPRFNGSAALVADGSVGLTLRYIGTEASATIEVNSSGDLLFKHGAAGGEVADTTVGIPTLNGTIDVSDAAANTFGEVVDNINNSPNWRAELVDTLRSDSSNDTLVTLAAHTFSPKNEIVSLFMDTSVSLNLSYAISRRRGVFSRSQNGKQSFCTDVKALVNVGSGTLILTIYDVTQNRAVATLLYTAAGVDNTELSVSSLGLISEYGHDLLVRYTCSVDLPDSGAYLRVQGYVE